MRNASYESRMIVWSSVVWSSDLAAATRSGLGRRPASLGQGLESRLLLHQRSGEWSPAARRQAGPAASEAASEIPFTLHCNTRANERGTGELNHSPQRGGRFLLRPSRQMARCAFKEITMPATNVKDRKNTRLNSSH